MKSALNLFTALLLCSIARGQEAPITTALLLARDSVLPAKFRPTNGLHAEKTCDGWTVSGKVPATIVLQPAVTNAWDVSKWNYVRIELRNDGPSVITVDGRLDNPGAQDWAGSCGSSAVVPAGGCATLGFAFNRAESDYRGPDIFRTQLAKPDGHRSHWKSFNPADIRQLRLVLRSSASNFKLTITEPAAAWPANEARDAALEAMPHLDELGQVRALDWPGKLYGADELRAALQRELAAATNVKRPTLFNRFGGWADGPALKATGNFRTEKRDGRWWLVDPDGKLFFSVGVCCAGFDASTPLSTARTNAGFFAWLPPTNDPLRSVGIWNGGKIPSINFPSMNFARAFGTNWNATARELVHAQIHAAGLNTLGAWSSADLMRDAKTPYTVTSGIWWPVWNDGGERMVSPFAKDFEESLRKDLQKLAWAKDDPFCIGAFIDNEIAWPDEFTPKIFAMPAWEPTKKWALEKVQEKYPDVAALNKAWGTQLADWKDFDKLSPSNIPQAARADIEPLYLDYAKAYFAKCRAVLNEVLPGKLYLGCRTHRGPKLVGRAAAGLVDVFSVNCYDTRAAAHQLDAATDIPVIVGEFHFGALDRGVPSPGLRSVHDQTQRGLAFASYLATALADPRFVGCHWFQWFDQSAAGRTDRENHQCGFVDVTGRLYPELARASALATQAMYPARASGTSSEQILEAVLAP